METSMRKKSPTFTFKTGLLSPSTSSSEKEFTKISAYKNTAIHTALTAKLQKAKQSIQENNDIYIDDEHKKLCYYYKKIMELKSKMVLKNKRISFTYKQNALINNNERLTFSEKNIKFIDTTYNYDIKYNAYNKKFINKIQNYIDVQTVQNFMQKQSEFLQTLSKREIYNLKYYTYHGDIYINAFIDGKFEPSIIQKYGDSIIDEGSDLCYFYYQFLDYFTSNPYFNQQEVSVRDENLFIEFIESNYMQFQQPIWTHVFTSYIQEMKQIFAKAPLTTDKIVLYRGVKDNYVASHSNKGFYISNHFSSTTLFAEVAFGYTNSKNRQMLKIIVDKGMPLIFVEGVSICKNEFEVILPINATLYIDHATKKINYFKQKDTIICPDTDNPDIVNMTTILYTAPN